MKSNLIAEYDKLFYKTAIGRFPLTAINEFDDLLEKYLNHETYDELIDGVKMAKSMIYRSNELYEESFEIDMNQLAYLSMEHYTGYYALINSATKTSEKLDKTEIVMPFAIDYLKNGKIDLYGKIFVLEWLVKHHPNKNNSFTDFERVFLELCEAMGYKIEYNLDFKTRMELIMKEFHRANKDLHQFRIKISGLSPIETNNILDQYLKTELLSFFREQAMGYKK
ncbi:hypothetical protein [Pedobacter cryophilus]|uniref:Uncharacterized protein n=1 Tax=Pedobacter cryophilus TaxID=2571271 RepID=A0A4U1BWQ2_9SPHI|nr:hypothetical protein [Pedobacter cryophilus]TKB95530.1 hypothetical protein FA046_16140 [Pedobacter cryophilus]